MLGRIFQWISEVLSSLRRSGTSAQPLPPSVSPPSSSGSENSTPSRKMTIVWGQKVSQRFLDRIVWAADSLGVRVDYLMAVIAFESGETFSPSVRNMAGSGATGLIQFMPSTARGMGTSTDKLAAMSAEDQIQYVYRYLLPYKGRMSTLSDVYMAVLWPRAIGKPESYVLWSKVNQPNTYKQNAGLDANKNGTITKAEAAAKVQEKLIKGRMYAWTGTVHPT